MEKILTWKFQLNDINMYHLLLTLLNQFKLIREVCDENDKKGSSNPILPIGCVPHLFYFILSLHT